MTSIVSRLSLTARLYSIFALFAVLTAAITVLSDYNSRRGAEVTEATETANLAALNVERVNSLVYAVVMESRGVYMSAEPDAVKKFGDGLLGFNDRILNMVKKWEAIVQADDAQQFATFKKRIEQFIDFRKELVRRAYQISPAAGREWGDNDANRAVRAALNKDLEALSRLYTERGKKIAQQAELNRQLSFVLTCLGGLDLLLVVIGVVIIARSIARPLARITSTIRQVAEGAEHVEVPHADRADEIGALARAIQIFQQAMDRNRNLNAQVSEESRAREARSRHIEASVEEFRQAIGAALRAVAEQRFGHPQYRTGHRPRNRGCQRPRRSRRQPDHAGLPQRLRRRQRGGGTVRLGTRDRPPGRPVHQRGPKDRPAHRKIDR